MGRRWWVVLAVALHAGACGDGEKASPDVDERLVGLWRNTRAVPRLIVSEVYCLLRANGTYLYGGSVIARSPNISPGTGGTTGGDWKAKDGHIFVKPVGYTEWVDSGRYSISGDSLVTYPPGGAPMYWER